MANTTVQNCQRGIIFITFVLVVLFFIVTVISLIKKLIDSSVEEGQDQSKYKEG
jgi:Na+-transporting methylmalonyl-CoA/oxaloacetate decarboxylase gamma subunit